MMGDSIVDIPAIRATMEAAAFDGYAEAEIFSERWWQRPMDEVIATCIARYKSGPIGGNPYLAINASSISAARFATGRARLFRSQ